MRYKGMDFLSEAVSGKFGYHPFPRFSALSRKYGAYRRVSGSKYGLGTVFSVFMISSMLFF